MRSILFVFLFLILPGPTLGEHLHDTWEADFVDSLGNEITLRLIIGPEEQTQIHQTIRLGENFLADLEGADIPPVETISIHAQGPHDADDDSLWINLTEVQMLADGEDLVEVFTEIARQFARFSADLLGISEAEYPAFEQAAIDELVGGLEEELISSLKGLPAGGSAWTLEGDMLTLTQGDRVLQLLRVDPDSAVAQTSWGQVKRMQHRE